MKALILKAVPALALLGLAASPAQAAINCQIYDGSVEKIIDTTLEVEWGEVVQSAKPDFLFPGRGKVHKGTVHFVKHRAVKSYEALFQESSYSTRCGFETSHMTEFATNDGQKVTLALTQTQFPSCSRVGNITGELTLSSSAQEKKTYFLSCGDDQAHSAEIEN